MKRDMDLIRQIMLEIEKHPGDGKWIKLSIPDRSNEEISFHVMLLAEADLVKAINLASHSTGRNHDYQPIRLTNLGYEFLENIRNDNVWNKTKETASSAGSFSIQVLVKLASEIATRIALANIHL